MKWTALFLFCGLTACGEQTKPGFADPEVLDAKYVRLLPDTNRLMLIEKVLIKYGDLRAEADSALLEKRHETLTVFGIKNASFKGEKIHAANDTFIRYKKGEAQPAIQKIALWHTSPD